MKISWLKSPVVIDFLKSYFSRFGDITSRGNGMSAHRVDIRPRLYPVADTSFTSMFSERNCTLTQREYEEGSLEDLSCALPVQFLHEPKIKIPNSPHGGYNGCLLEYGMAQLQGLV